MQENRLTVEQASNRLKFTRQGVYRLIKENKLAAETVFGVTVVSSDEVERIREGIICKHINALKKLGLEVFIEPLTGQSNGTADDKP